MIRKLTACLLVCAFALLFVVLWNGAGCTAEQEAPYRKAAEATTRTANDPVVRTVGGAVPYGTPTLEIVSILGNVALGVLSVIQKKSHDTTKKKLAVATSGKTATPTPAPAPAPAPIAKPAGT